MLNKSHYDFRDTSGQKYLMWQTPWEQEWEMLASLWSCQPVDAGVSCRTQPFAHQGTQPSLRLFYSHSSNQSCSQVIPGAKGQQTGRSRNLSSKQRWLYQRCFAKDEQLWLLQKLGADWILLLHTDSLSLTCKREMQHKICWDLDWNSNLVSVNLSWFESLTRTQEPCVSCWIYSLLQFPPQWEGSYSWRFPYSGY